MGTHYLLITGCEDPDLHGDGICDDFRNIEACFFDGGDCCGSNAFTDLCTECQCLEEGGGVSGACFFFLYEDWIGDGFCDDVTNNEACFFDGGDCCSGIIDFCTECQCLEGGGGGGSGGTTTGGACDQGWIADGYCDDNNNNIDCTYDGGDCCGSDVNTDYCNICQCLEGGGGSGGTSIPSGTTAGGSCNLGNADWIADGYCDDINNNLACSYDGGDCCLMNFNTDSCSGCNCLGM